MSREWLPELNVITRLKIYLTLIHCQADVEIVDEVITIASGSTGSPRNDKSPASSEKNGYTMEG